MKLNKIISSIAAASIVFGISVINTDHAYAVNIPVSGAKCSKQNLTQVYKNKRFVCVRTTKGLVWNKGVSLPKPKPVIEPKLPFEISSKSLDANVCKLKHPNRYETGFGFTRSENRLPSTGTINSIFIFVEFVDAIGTDSPADTVKLYFDKFNEYYKSVSYGKVNFTYDVPNRYFKINKSQNSYDMNLIRGSSNPNPGQYFMDSLAAADPYVDFSKYDVVYVIPSNTVTEITYGPAFPMSPGSSMLKTNEKTFMSGAVAGIDSRQRANSLEWVWLAHETGHLFGLEHPWLVDSTPVGQTTIGSTIGIWDLMLNMWKWSTQSHEMLGWSRFILGWVEDKNINCQDALDSNWNSINIRISPIAKQSDETKLSIIKLTDKTAIVIESRKNMAFDIIPSSYEGALIYLVDVTKHSNEGMATIISSNKNTIGGLSIGTMQTGQSIMYNNMLIEILLSNSSGEYLRVTKK